MMSKAPGDPPKMEEIIAPATVGAMSQLTFWYVDIKTRIRFKGLSKIYSSFSYCYSNNTYGNGTGSGLQSSKRIFACLKQIT